VTENPMHANFSGTLVTRSRPYSSWCRRAATWDQSERRSRQYQGGERKKDRRRYFKSKKISVTNDRKDIFLFWTGGW